MTHDKLLFVLICYALLTFSLACCGAFLCTVLRAFREEAERKKIDCWLKRSHRKNPPHLNPLPQVGEEEK